MKPVEWRSAREAAQYCGVHYDTFTKLARAEGLRPDGHIGKRPRYATATLDRWLRMRALAPRLVRKAS